MPLIRKTVYKTRNVSKVHGCAALHLESDLFLTLLPSDIGERGGSVVECRTPEREVRGSRPTSAVLCLEQDTLLPESTG